VASLPRVLDPALRPHNRRSPARHPRTQGPGQEDGHGECPLGRAAHPWGDPETRPRRGRAHRVPADAEAAPSQTWRTFLANHARDLVSIDFFTVPTARLRVLFVLVVLAHHRRHVIHFNITEQPTAAMDRPADRGRVPGRLRALLSPTPS
jgi:hypothetical protein